MKVYSYNDDRKWKRTYPVRQDRDFNNLVVKFEVVDDMETKKKLDETWLMSIHETDQSDKGKPQDTRDFENENFQYVDSTDFESLDEADGQMMNGLFEIMDMIESCSITLSDVFHYNGAKYQYPAFRL